MADWPIEISRESFRRAWPLEGESFWQSVLELHQDKMQIKNTKAAALNLEKIFNATFQLVYRKGFQAMSLRDLSQAAGISMGGLYAYIGSKEDLAMAVQKVLRQYNEAMVGQLTETTELTEVQRIKAIVYGEIYMMEQLSAWYYFCYMELKGLPKELQQQNMELELTLEKMLLTTFEKGIQQGKFHCLQPNLLAAQVTAGLQQWYLKFWKFKSTAVSAENYAQFVVDTTLKSLEV